MKQKKIMFLILVLFLLINVGFVKAATYSNYSTGSKVYCGGSDATSAAINNIPSMFPKTINVVYVGLEITIPVVLIIFGMIDMIKAITAGKEDEIKKNQMIFLRRLVVAALSFFVFAIVKLLVNFVADNNKQNILDCVNCFINYTVNNNGKCGS